jgi:hypothetical protein
MNWLIESNTLLKEIDSPTKKSIIELHHPTPNKKSVLIPINISPVQVQEAPSTQSIN